MSNSVEIQIVRTKAKRVFLWVISSLNKLLLQCVMWTCLRPAFSYGLVQIEQTLLFFLTFSLCPHH